MNTDIIDELEKIKEKFVELPKKYQSNVKVVGFGSSIKTLNTICEVCDLAIDALKEGHNSEVSEGLKRLITDAKRDLGLVATLISPDGVKAYDYYLNELFKFSQKIESRGKEKSPSKRKNLKEIFERVKDLFSLLFLISIVVGIIFLFVNNRNNAEPIDFKLHLAELKPAIGLKAVTRSSGDEETVYVDSNIKFDNNDIKNAHVVKDAYGYWTCIEIILKPEARKKLLEITKEHINGPLAIFLDGKLYSIPIVQQSITDGIIQIHAEDYKNAKRIADGIKSKRQSK